MVTMQGHADWDSVDSTDWTTNDYVEAFATAAIKNASVKANRYPAITPDEVKQLALDALYKMAQLWPTWAAAQTEPPVKVTDLKIFYALVKKRIAGDLLDWQKHKFGRAGTEEEKKRLQYRDPDSFDQPVETHGRKGKSGLDHAMTLGDTIEQTASQAPDETLNDDIVTTMFKEMAPQQLVVLLLRYYEDLSLERIHELVNTGHTKLTVTRIHQRAVEAVHHIGRWHVGLDSPLEVKKYEYPRINADLLVEWIHETYNLGTDEWYERAQEAMRQDKSILLSIVSPPSVVGNPCQVCNERPIRYSSTGECPRCYERRRRVLKKLEAAA